jgi:hypothetical protein
MYAKEARCQAARCRRDYVMWRHLPKMGVVVRRLERREGAGVILLNLRSHRII